METAVGIGVSISNTYVDRHPIHTRSAKKCQIIFLADDKAESPRFLVLNDRLEEAWATVSKLHYDPDDEAQAAARSEYTQIVKQVEHDKRDKLGIVQLFKVRSLRKRCILTFLLQYVKIDGSF